MAGGCGFTLLGALGALAPLDAMDDVLATETGVPLAVPPMDIGALEEQGAGRWERCSQNSQSVSNSHLYAVHTTQDAN